MGDLLGRRARSRRDRRGLHGASHGRPRRRRPPPGRCPQLHRGAGRHRRLPGLHAHVARALRPLALGGDPGDPARARPPQARASALGLQLRLLGAADPCRAFDRHALPAGAPPSRGAPRPRDRPRADGAAADRLEPARLRHPLVQRPTRPAGPRARARLRGALADRPAGARRLLGRDPAAVGLVADRLRLPRPRARVAVPSARDRRLEAVHGRRRRPPPAGGLPVARLGHLPRARRASRRGGRGGGAGAAEGGPMAPSGGGQGARRLGCPASRGRARRLGLRVRQRPLSRHRRRGSRRHRAERARHRPTLGLARLRLDRGDAVSKAAAGGPSTRTTTPTGSTRSRSSTSARSSTRRASTSRATPSSSSPRSRATRTPPAAVWTTCSPSRRRTAPGSGAGA